jgi:glycosyltransferase involved in cell wall biosynthesis
MNSKIISPMGRGSGAYVIHRILERQIPGYRVIPYHANWTLVPFALRLAASFRAADLIHTVPDYAVFFYRKALPMVISFQNYVLDIWMRPYCSLLQKIHYATDLRIWTRSAIKKAQKITAVSRFTADLVRKDLKLSDPIDIIHNGVDADHFTPNPVKRNDQKKIHVFFSGNLTRRKGAHWLPEIAKHLNRNIKIFYTQGLRTRGVLPDLPNLSGLPVVASHCSSLPEQIDEGKGGFLCPVGDAQSFAEKINLLADSPKLRNEMGGYNRGKVEERFTKDKMIAGYKNLFKNLLSLV